MDFTLDSTGDIDFITNDIVLNDGLDAIRQHLTVKFQDVSGEWVFDTEVGFPWFESVLKKNPSFTELQNIFLKEITDTLGVIEVLELNFETDDVDDRMLNISFQALCDDGILDFSLVREI